MIVKNEAELIGPLLKRVRPLVGEIIVVDTGSSDATAVQARKHADLVLYYPLTSDFSAARNYSITMSNLPWTLVLDADEMPSDTLLSWLATTKPAQGVGGYLIRRENMLDGELLSEDRGYEWHVRLFKKPYLYGGVLHEHPDIPTKEIRNAPGDALLLHHKSSQRQEKQNILYAGFVNDHSVRLNLGCGGRTIRGWVNVDAREVPGVDLIHDLREPLPFRDQSVDEIWSDQVLEHFSYHAVSKIIGDWMRVLKIGGKITISTPDLDEMIKGYLDGRLDYLRFIQLMYGGQVNEFDYHTHTVNPSWITGQLRYYGCDTVKFLPTIWWNLAAQGTKVRHV
jgi:glycosyltransferase involved in cell wall biosynthesis